ncbi:MAG TPA: DEAD/DEAH box helicase, partial [Pirellulaceae bacterium]|nr:DEAD/DEAH box helicase [Pirellulaceae bacterium]
MSDRPPAPRPRRPKPAAAAAPDQELPAARPARAERQPDRTAERPAKRERPAPSESAAAPAARPAARKSEVPRKAEAPPPPRAEKPKPLKDLPPGAKRERDAAQPTFRDMDLSDEMLEALDAAGYTEPTPIQAGLIPLAIDDVDVLGQARTGTGKTAAFVIPILEGLHPSRDVHGPQAIILVPTRELAVQVREEVVKLSHGRHISFVALYGGKPIRGQIEKLRQKAMVVVGTPGRVLDHIARNTLL